LTQAVAGVVLHTSPLHILDLGSGTGSNVRYLSPRLTGAQEWLLVDRDPALLLEVPDGTASCRIETLCRDLDTLDDAAIFAGRDLVTASALLDLVSARWIDTLAASHGARRSNPRTRSSGT
jgi:trans-aconitate methyltransferase